VSTPGYQLPPRHGWRRVLLPYVLLYTALLLVAVAVGLVAGREVADAIGGSEHVGELLGIVAALIVLRRVYVVLTRWLARRWMARRQMGQPRSF
jgi:uncharacterized membrane protein YcjF (UPF0283 family)